MATDGTTSHACDSAMQQQPNCLQIWQILHNYFGWRVLVTTVLARCFIALCFPVVQDYYELGVILTRKKLYTQATKNLEKAKKLWDGEESDLAQVSGC